MTEKHHPDISDILAAKARGRQEITGLSFGEKIEMMEKLCNRLKPFQQARETRKAARGRQNP